VNQQGVTRRIAKIFAVCACASALALALHAAAVAQAPRAQRKFEVDDLFELESMGHYFGGPFSWSADGSKLAFTKIRGKKSFGNYKWENLTGGAGGDVHVQLDASAKPLAVTHGIEDSSGWWSPKWSPDGRKLAMLSTRGGNVHLWIWHSDTRQLRKLGERGVDVVDPRERPYIWIDDTRIIFAATSQMDQPLQMSINLQAIRTAVQEWPKVEQGIETTASEIESGVPVDLDERSKGELLVVDVTTGAERTIAHGNFHGMQLAPDGRTVAFMRQIGVYLPKADRKLPFDYFGGATFTLEIVPVDGSPLRFKGQISHDVLEGSIRWSPDGRELAFFGYAGGRETPPLLYRANLARRTVSARSLGKLNVTASIRKSAQLEWTGNSELLVLAAKAGDDAQPDSTERRDWWLVKKSGELKCLTTGISDPPPVLHPEPGRAAFFGIANEELWRIKPASGDVSNLTLKFAPKIKAIEWPLADDHEGTVDLRRAAERAYKHALFSVQIGSRLELYRLSLADAAIVAISKPAPDADLIDYEPQIDSALFRSSDRSGLRVWTANISNGRSFLLVRANEFLNDIAEGELRQLQYTSLDGERLKAWVLLPPGYRAGQRYPLLTWVYAGSVLGDQPPRSLGSINSDSFLNMQIPAAKDYAVLFPSMPLKTEGVREDPMLRLPEGVLPAVDKVIELGIADENRLYLMGQSFGGFAAYGLITQTNRFHAAVSLAGLSNLISLYSTFMARERYTDRPQEQLFIPSALESAQVAMGNPPWKDLGRYLRNSPIFFADRVRTPLMIVQGDMDFVPIQQGEEFFMSLYRQGKRASFVRYWGEGHSIASPANIRDMWQRIFRWLEQFPSKG
jgi:dipeptidyl aminopeptidase/acylaminoacyl peptidase